MKTHQYKNYEEYVEKQQEANRLKIESVWVKRHSIEWIVGKCENVRKIICHGTRNGKEQEYFKEYIPNSDVIGTEISSNASQFPMTVQWDFAEPKEEWVENFDLLYSNSIDHSYNIYNTLETWYNQLRSGGYFVIEMQTGWGSLEANEWDPLSISCEEMESLLKIYDMELVDTFIPWGVWTQPKVGQWQQNNVCKIYLYKKL